MISPSRTKSGAEAGRLPSLDGIRGIAALMVMAFHFTLQLRDPSGIPAMALTGLFSPGWTGVDLFFVLSGFLITGLLADAKGSSNYFRVFYARRMLRILPLYYAALILLFGVPMLAPAATAARWVTPFYDQLWYWLYLQNFHPLPSQFVGLAGHLWSLAIEEQFYLVWPVVILLLSRRGALRACVVCVAVSILWRLASLVAPFEMNTYNVTPARLDGLAIGSAVALVARGPGGLAALRRWAIPATIVAAVIAAAYFLLPTEFDDNALIAPTSLTVGAGLVVFPIAFTAIALLFASLLLHGLRTDRVAPSFLEWSALRSAGRYSYGLYVVHVPLIPLMYLAGFSPAKLIPRIGSEFAALALYIVGMLAASFAVAWLSWHLYEKRFLALKKHFAYQWPRDQGVK